MSKIDPFCHDWEKKIVENGGSIIKDNGLNNGVYIDETAVYLGQKNSPFADFENTELTPYQKKVLGNIDTIMDGSLRRKVNQRIRFWRRVRLLILVIILLLVTAFTFANDDIKILAATPRVTGHNDAAKDYIIKELKKDKLQVVVQSFLIKQGRVNSVFGIRKGDNTVIIIGAHYDSVPRSPGADDNASGCALVLELARRIKSNKSTIIFAFFSGEEQGLYGSAYYCENPIFPLKKTKVMINADMIGHLKIMKKDSVDTALGKAFKKYPFASDITFRIGSFGSDSDSFFNKGVKIICLHTGLHRHYHKSSDKIDTLNLKGISLIINYAEDLVRFIDGRSNYDDLFNGMKLCVR